MANRCFMEIGGGWVIKPFHFFLAWKWSFTNSSKILFPICAIDQKKNLHNKFIRYAEKSMIFTNNTPEKSSRDFLRLPLREKKNPYSGFRQWQAEHAARRKVVNLSHRIRTQFRFCSSIRPSGTNRPWHLVLNSQGPKSTQRKLAFFVPPDLDGKTPIFASSCMVASGKEWIRLLLQTRFPPHSDSSEAVNKD